MKVTVDGRHIDQFIPRDLRGMFYRNPIPDYKYRVVDGYDPYGFSTEGLVLYLPLWALKDSVFKSVDAYKHLCTPSGTTISWTPLGWSLGGTDELITIPHASSIDAGAGSWTVEAWVYLDNLTDENIIAFKLEAAGDTPGYLFYVEKTTGVLKFLVRESATVYKRRDSTAGMAATTWMHIGGAANSVGGSLVLYLNGAVEAGTTFEAGAWPDTTSTRDLLIGKSDVYDAGFFDGLIGEVWIYKRALSAGEILHNYKCTVARYQ